MFSDVAVKKDTKSSEDGESDEEDEVAPGTEDEGKEEPETIPLSEVHVYINPAGALLEYTGFSCANVKTKLCI